MKRIAIFCISVLFSYSIFSQEAKIVVVDEYIPTIEDDVHYPNDHNKIPTGLLIVKLDKLDAKFKGDTICKPKYIDGKYWIFMVDGASYIEISVNGYPPISHEFKTKIKSGLNYCIEVKSEQSKKKEELKEDYLTIRCNVTNAKIYINEEQVNNDNPNEGSKLLTLNMKYTWRIEAKDYYTETGEGIFEAKKEMLVELQPILKYAKVQKNDLNNSDNKIGKSKSANEKTSWLFEKQEGFKAHTLDLLIGDYATLKYSYTRSHIGFYATIGVGEPIYIGGAVFRLTSSNKTRNDWQIYTGLGSALGEFAFDYGIRVAFGKREIWRNKLSIGRTITSNFSFYNIGIIRFISSPYFWLLDRNNR